MIDPLLAVGALLLSVAGVLWLVRRRRTGRSMLPAYRPGETVTMTILGALVGGGLALSGVEVPLVAILATGEFTTSIGVILQW